MDLIQRSLANTDNNFNPPIIYDEAVSERPITNFQRYNKQKFNINKFCQCKQNKALVQKDNKMNTSYNSTQISKAMYFSQSVKIRQCVYLNR